MVYVTSLLDATATDIASLGGKGAHLARLLQARLPVPSGFVVKTSAYHRFIAHNHLQDQITYLARAIDPQQSAAFEQASRDIRTLIEQGQMPPDIREEVLASYQEIDAPAVAVRSSATAEDLPQASFAGQQESYLNVRGPEALLGNLLRCWSSLWTPRVLSYRQRQNLYPDQVSIAVVVQTMLPADASGVLFTANPVTGARGELLINATWGLGEALVGGHVTPDHLTLSRADGHIQQMIISDKHLATLLTEQGVTEHELPLAQRQQPALTEKHISRLYHLGLAIEELFQTAQDIEWVRVGDDLFIVQSRPITTRPAMQTVAVSQEQLPVPGDDTWDHRQPQPAPQPYDIWTRTNMGENFPFPITPYSATLWPVIYLLNRVPSREERAANPALEQSMRRFYGRVYVNEGQLIHTYTQLGIPRAFSDMTWGSRQRANEPGNDRFSLFKLLRGLPATLKDMRTQVPPKPATSQKQPTEKIPRLKGDLLYTYIDRWVADFQQQDLSQFDDLTLWTHWMTRWTGRSPQLGVIMATAIQAAFFLYQLETRLKKWTGRAGLSTALLQSLNGVYTAEVAPALWEMLQTLKKLHLEHIVRDQPVDEALHTLEQRADAQPFQQQLHTFLDRHDYRCPNDAELYNPRWGEEPQQVIELLKDYLHLDAQYDPLAVQRRQQHERDLLERQLMGQLNPIRRIIFRWLLKQARASTRRRDNNRSYVAKFFYPMRLLAKELGRRWTQRGWLTQPQDIFFLTVYEIDDLVHTEDPLTLGKPLTQICADRRAAFDYWHTIQPPEALGPTGEPLPPREQHQPFLQGLPASSGRIRGTARIVRTLSEAHQLRKGDILITSATDPGWTSLFPLIGGLVLEIGGQLSHGAIIAREYGIPAAINVPQALQTIHDGQVITLDGNTGCIYLEEDSPIHTIPGSSPLVANHP